MKHLLTFVLLSFAAVIVLVASNSRALPDQANPKASATPASLAAPRDQVLMGVQEKTGRLVGAGIPDEEIEELNTPEQREARQRAMAAILHPGRFEEDLKGERAALARAAAEAILVPGTVPGGVTKGKRP